ncbi:pantetheine-phosphate adenylyltransferase [archaeon]
MTSVVLPPEPLGALRRKREREKAAAMGKTTAQTAESTDQLGEPAQVSTGGPVAPDVDPSQRPPVGPPSSSAKAPATICLGGTFSKLHLGHEHFLTMAFALGGAVEIGLTSDKFASRKKHGVPPFAERKAGLQHFLSEMGWEATIRKIGDAYGFALDPRFKTIVVSEETKPNAELINKKRAEMGFQPLDIVAVPIIKNEEGEKITSG